MISMTVLFVAVMHTTTASTSGAAVRAPPSSSSGRALHSPARGGTLDHEQSIRHRSESPVSFAGRGARPSTARGGAAGGGGVRNNSSSSTGGGGKSSASNVSARSTGRGAAPAGGGPSSKAAAVVRAGPLSSCRLLLVGVRTAAAKVLAERASQKGAEVLRSPSSAATHVLVGRDQPWRAAERTKVLSACPRAKVLSTDWLTEFLRSGTRPPEAAFRLPPAAATAAEKGRATGGSSESLREVDGGTAQKKRQQRQQQERPAGSASSSGASQAALRADSLSPPRQRQEAEMAAGPPLSVLQTPQQRKDAEEREQQQQQQPATAAADAHGIHATTPGAAAAVRSLAEGAARNNAPQPARAPSSAAAAGDDADDRGDEGWPTPGRNGGGGSPGRPALYGRGAGAPMARQRNWRAPAVGDAAAPSSSAGGSGGVDDCFVEYCSAAPESGSDGAAGKATGGGGGSAGRQRQWQISSGDETPPRRARRGGVESPFGSSGLAGAAPRAGRSSSSVADEGERPGAIAVGAQTQPQGVPGATEEVSSPRSPRILAAEAPRSTADKAGAVGSAATEDNGAFAAGDLLYRELEQSGGEEDDGELVDESSGGYGGAGGGAGGGGGGFGEEDGSEEGGAGAAVGGGEGGGRRAGGGRRGRHHAAPSGRSRKRARTAGAGGGGGLGPSPFGDAADGDGAADEQPIARPLAHGELLEEATMRFGPDLSAVMVPPPQQQEQQDKSSDDGSERSEDGGDTGGFRGYQGEGSVAAGSRQPMPRVSINNAMGNKNEHLTDILDELEDICACPRPPQTLLLANIFTWLVSACTDAIYCSAKGGTSRQPFVSSSLFGLAGGISRRLCVCVSSMQLNHSRSLPLASLRWRPSAGVPCSHQIWHLRGGAATAPDRSASPAASCVASVRRRALDVLLDRSRQFSIRKPPPPTTTVVVAQPASRRPATAVLLQ